jgi:hypothetical protein
LLAQVEFCHNFWIYCYLNHLTIGFLYFLRHGFQSSSQPLRLQDQWAQGEEHMADFFRGLACQVFDLTQLLNSSFRIALKQATDEVDSHGNRSDGLGGTIM